MNSFSAMNRAIDYEISRQVLLHSQVKAIRFSKTLVYGKKVLRFAILHVVQIMSLIFICLFSFGLFMDQKTFTMRKKEGLVDYRYFPEPDLPEVVLTKEFVDKLCQGLPELPEAKRRRYEKMGLAMQDVLFLANDNHVGIVKISGYFRDKQMSFITGTITIDEFCRLLNFLMHLLRTVLVQN